MKKQDFLFIFVLVIIFLPFFVSESIYNWYKSFNAGKSSVSCPLKPSDSAPLKHSTMPP